MKNTKKSNIGLALFLSLLTALGGSLLFGIVYALGYYIYILAVAEIVLSCSVFLRFCNNSRKRNIFFAIVWGLIWTFILNVVAIIICEAFFVMAQFNTDFVTAFYAIIELWKTDLEFAAYMNTRVLQVAGMILIGGIVYGVSYLIQRKKKNLNQTNNQPTPQSEHTHPIQSETSQPMQDDTIVYSTPNTQSKDQSVQNYENLINKIKDILIKYVQDKNADELKSSIIEIKQNHVNHLSVDEKQKIREQALKEIEKENISKIEKKSIETLLKIIK